MGVMTVCKSSIGHFHGLNNIFKFNISLVYLGIGFIFALTSTIIFVLQNIFSKKLFLQTQHSHTQRHDDVDVKMDKINLLYYSSFLAFIFMTPLWFYVEGYKLLTDTSQLPNLSVCVLIILNGMSHFAQNILAFTILSQVSPVTYSIASLVKRIFVITSSIIWFGDDVGVTQACGITLTFVGLWLYDRAKGKKIFLSCLE